MMKNILGIIALVSLLSSSLALSSTRDCVVFFSPEGKSNDFYYYEAVTISKLLAKEFKKQGIRVTKDISQANIGINLWSIPLVVGQRTIDQGPFGTFKEDQYAEGIMLFGFEGGKIILRKDYYTSNLLKTARKIIHDLKCE
ncbi:MAG: hypothetical protein ACOVP4_13940 [Bacteriovoracaceae bacterium]